jgi:hypothetical protein
LAKKPQRKKGGPAAYAPTLPSDALTVPKPGAAPAEAEAEAEAKPAEEAAPAQAARSERRPERRIVLEPWGPRGLRWGFFAAGAFYIAMIWLEAWGNSLPGKLLPPSLHYFTQSAALFTRAAEIVTEWHVRGYNCDHQKFEEIDVRPYFPIHADDKENRFDRAMHFYMKHKRVLKALDRYIVKSESDLGPAHRIGGVEMLSLRLPIPPLGADEEPYDRRPIDSYPENIERHIWWITDKTLRERRCAESATTTQLEDAQ